MATFDSVVRNKWLADYVKNRNYFCGEQKAFLYGDSTFKSDGAWSLDKHCKDSKNFVILEAEGSTGTSALSNVAKYWVLLEDDPSLQITLVQVLSERFHTKKGRFYLSHLIACRHLAKIMEKHFEKRFHFHSFPRDIPIVSYAGTKEDVQDLFKGLLANHS